MITEEIVAVIWLIIFNPFSRVTDIVFSSISYPRLIRQFIKGHGLFYEEGNPKAKGPVSNKGIIYGIFLVS